MILIADSGSTKTQWCKITEKSIDILVNTTGINPFLLSLDEIISSIRPVSADVKEDGLTAIYFFGAGCAIPSSKQKIGSALYEVFECHNIIVDSDIIGSCLSLAGNTPAIVAMLGTGSNSCLWNGDHIEQQIPSLGYILGDEGAGVSIGKQLVSDFLKKQMPLDLRLKFIEKYDVSVEIVLERVYRMQMPNQYLAGFAPFIDQFPEHPYCVKLVDQQIESFIVRNLLSYDKKEHLNIHFSGSIAFAYQSVIHKMCRKHKLKAGKIEKEPIHELAAYLRKKNYNQ
jgi:glucosamine kinase